MITIWLSRVGGPVQGLALMAAFLFSGLMVGEAEEAKGIRFEFKVFGLHPGDYKGIYFLNREGNPERLEFRSRQRSVSYEYVSDEPFLPVTFFRIEGEGEERVFRPVARVMAYPGWAEILFLFYQPRSGDGSSSMEVVAAKENENIFPYGSMRVFNLTGIPLFGSIDKRAERIRRNELTDSFKIRNAGEVDVVFAAQNEEKLHLVYRKILPLQKDGRTLLILRPPTRKGSIRIAASMLQDFKSDVGDAE